MTSSLRFKKLCTGVSEPSGMLLASVCAEGVSTINNADQIERGYERIEERLNALGAKITRVPERTR